MPVNIGKPYDDVQERQRRRKIQAVKEGVKRAVWFCDSFGLDLISVAFKSKAGESVCINYDESAQHVNASSDDGSSDVEVMILYLLDKFGISDAFYHELSMVNPLLPRSYLIKHVINSSIIIQRLPAPVAIVHSPGSFGTK